MSTVGVDTSFYKKCTVCKGTGELRSSHPDAVNVNGRPTGYAYPARSGGMSGEVVAEATRSICGACLGCGLKLLRKK